MLTDIECRNAKGRSKSYKLFDNHGLFLFVTTKGARHWRMKYRFNGKEKSLSFGSYPVLSLLDARERCQEAKRLILDGADPSELKQQNKLVAKYAASQTFEAVAREWHKLNYDTWCLNHANSILHRLETQVFPHIGSIPIAKLTPPQVLACLQDIEKRSKEMARRALQMCSQVLRYAVGTGRAERDFTVDLRGLLKKYVRGHFAAIGIEELPDFLKALDRNEARLYHQTIHAIKLLMLTFVRTSELINATWNEINLKKAEWKIPAERMKMRKPHLVPLSRQAIELLRKQKKISAKSDYVFPSITRPKKPMSNNTILMALRRMKYNRRMTGHGFRALAMTTIKEKLGYRHEVVDRQLAHEPKSKVDKAYDRAGFISERVNMMQAWANYLDMIKK